MPSRFISLLLIREAEVDLEGCQQMGPSIISGGRMTYAELRIDETRHALDLVDLVESLEIRRVKGHDLEVLCDPGGCDGFGERVTPRATGKSC